MEIRDKQIIKEEISNLLKKDVQRIVLSNSCDADSDCRKYDIRRMIHKGKVQYQITTYTEKQAFQTNVDMIILQGKIIEIFPDKMKQLNAFTAEGEISLKITKKGKLLKNFNTKSLSKTSLETSHNRKKNYILKEGTVIPPLVDMGVFTKEGKVVNSMYDKFKQINRFIEMVDDVLKEHAQEEINIIDFGCGKSYLTFIIYYYLREVKNKQVNIIGLDLKKDVIDKCNKTADKYGYKGLRFELGDINGYKTEMRVDMVVTLHACDTATDYALYNAVEWNAKYILSVPCCQHEVNKQISSQTLAPMMKYGIVKERMAALATDSLRGSMLEYKGYKTQLLEFVDMTHSPKNILIRAVKNGISKDKREKALAEATEMCAFLDIEPTIYKLLCKSK